MPELLFGRTSASLVDQGTSDVHLQIYCQPSAKVGPFNTDSGHTAFTHTIYPLCHGAYKSKQAQCYTALLPLCKFSVLIQKQP